jgi:hypothetical protein
VFERDDVERGDGGARGGRRRDQRTCGGKGNGGSLLSGPSRAVRLRPPA